MLFKAWKETPEKIFGAPFKAGSISLEINPALLGVGYIIGPRIASHHVRRRRARLSRAHPGDQILRRKLVAILAPGTMPISRHGAG